MGRLTYRIEGSDTETNMKNLSNNGRFATELFPVIQQINILRKKFLLLPENVRNLHVN